MDRYIGLDVHAASCTAAIVDGHGKRLGAHVIETNGEALVKFLATQSGNVRVCMEEGTQSEWLYQILSPHAKEVVVLGLHERSGPCEQKSDELDAYGLADRHRRNTLPRAVFKDTGQLTALRQLVKTYAALVQDSVRVQNRLKAVFRSRGVQVTGKNISSAKSRLLWLDKLPNAIRSATSRLYDEYDALKLIREQTRKELVAESHRLPIAKILETCPGLGEIRVAQLLAIVMTPHRFRTRQQFWSYCGLGIVSRSSSDWVQTRDGSWARAQVQKTRGLNRIHNRMLKAVFKAAATSLLLQKKRDSPLLAGYERMLAGGTKPNLAKVTLARKIAAITLAMWKTKEVYHPKEMSIAS